MAFILLYGNGLPTAFSSLLNYNFFEGRNLLLTVLVIVLISSRQFIGIAEMNTLSPLRMSDRVTHLYNQREFALGGTP